MSDVLHKLPEFIGNHLALAALFVILILGIVVMELMRLMRKYKELTPAGLTLLMNRESPLLVDVSAYADYEKSHIPGAKHVAMSQFDPEGKDLSKAKDLPIVLIDKDGRGNAEKAAQRLVKAGFTKVHTLGGGIFAWQQAQLPTAKGNK
ncbi:MULTISPECIES: rhodanese-like domain-containing protein [Dyella]|uniref:Rhodanese-like domain-containing protein n=2 Tax=Dyella TaxID=231454 RepID=A0A4R0YPB3_9GAMM|nr:MULTISPECIES: rhodanese-like domain-containing protein [Dyella]TBR36713.1 rhodanese-like domain-containing protein [Dyella terrae]TCI08196.1 rhodanese-like domain-containing protein [Dyella soli]